MTPVDDIADDAADNYYESHYETWLDVFFVIKIIPDNESYAVDVPFEIDHIQYVAFDLLAVTNRTLIVRRDGITYRINGRNIPESMRGHNQKRVYRLTAIHQPLSLRGGFIIPAGNEGVC